MAEPIKVIKIYRSDDPDLLSLIQFLTRRRGAYVTYAEAVRYLLKLHKAMQGNGKG